MDGSGGLIVEDKVWVVGWSYCGGQGLDGSGGLIVEDKVWMVVVILLWRTRYGW